MRVIVLLGLLLILSTSINSTTINVPSEQPTIQAGMDAASNGSNLQVTKNLTSMPLAFTENQGQWDEQVLYRANAGGATMWFTKDGAVYQFTRTIESEDNPLSVIDKRYGMKPDDIIDRQPDSIESIAIKANFIGANPNPRMVGLEEMEYKCNYFIGNDPNEWHTDVPNYQAIIYDEIYEGIDLKYYGNGTQMEYDFIVSPGADFSQIKIDYEGAESITVNADGELVVETMWGEVVEQRPVIYQIENNNRVAVEGVYRLHGDNSFGFEISAYNLDTPLIIDPVLSFSTYLGGTGQAYSFGIVIDSLGNSYVSGMVFYFDFPTEGEYQSYQGSVDVFVTKFSSSGSSLVYSTYLGGSTEERAQGMAIDNLCNIYVTGFTNSEDFPIEGAYQTTFQGGSYDVFVTKLNSLGNALDYSTFLGGSDTEEGWDITVDGLYNAYISGNTYSSDFPTEMAYQSTFQGGSEDAFVTKLNSAGNALVYSSFLGGSSYEAARSITVDDLGNTYISGRTSSSDFPIEGEYQIHQGSTDIFVTKLNSSGTGLIFSTYLGGSLYDASWDIDVDNFGSVYVTGYTNSSDFPIEGGFQNTLNGSESDAFVIKLNSSGDAIVYSTFLGGSGVDEALGISVDGLSNAYISGYTYSSDFPTELAYQTTFQGGPQDAFVTKLNSSGNSLVYSTYLGGSDNERAQDIVVDDSGNTYITGYTSSSDFPIEGEYQTQQGATNAFVSKFNWVSNPPQIISIAPSQNELNVSASSDITVSFDVDMDASSFNDSTFVILAQSTGLHQGLYTYDSLAKTATFDPNVDFRVGDNVMVTLTTGVRSIFGHNIVACHVWNFNIIANEGVGIYSIHSELYSGSAPGSIVSGDFNNDNHLDIAVVNRNNDNMSVFLNNGHGNFETHTSYYIGDDPWPINAVDINNDGYLDLIATAWDRDSSSYFLCLFNNLGDGTFDFLSKYQTSLFPISISAADFNGDGYIDIAVANQDGVNVAFLLNNGDNTFSNAIYYSLISEPRSICSADLDNDDDVDVAICGGDSVTILWNDGEGGFGSSSNFEITGLLDCLIASDFDGDGDIDIALASHGTEAINILRNDGNSDFSFGDDFTVGENPTSIYASDFDSDGDLDIVSSNQSDGSISILKNVGNCNFIYDSTYILSGNNPQGLCTGDFDNDDDIDIMVTVRNPDNVTLFANLECFPPIVEDLFIDGQSTNYNIVDNVPLIEWSYYDSTDYEQVQFEIAVGIDNDWTVAEMWNPTPYETTDTFILYAGEPLIDGEVYYLSLRVNNGYVWSNWYETPFLMNSIPSIPIPLQPINDAFTNATPTLLIENSTDAEGDPLTYDFFCVVDTTYGEPDPINGYDVPEGTDSTGWQVTELLDENKRYFWNVRAYDSYEYSEWTDLFSSTFFVNETPEPPTEFLAQFPPDTGGMPVWDMLTYFYWNPAYDPDPFDIVRYKLEVASDSNFTFVNTIDSIDNTPYTLTDSLQFGTHYWWKVTAFDKDGLSTQSTNIPDFWTWKLGDINHDHNVNVADLTYMVNYVFKGGTAIYPEFVGDVDHSCTLNVTDLVYMVNYVFKGGPDPLVGCE